MTTGSGEIFLSILVPTFNRSAKLIRLLNKIDQELGTCSWKGRVDVIVSDNCSTDGTAQAVAGFVPANFRLHSHRQESNLGMDGNMAFLFRQAAAPYVWYMSDDDIIHAGSIERILAAVSQHSPSIFLFEFEQPPGNRTTHLGNIEKLTSFTEPIDMINLVTRWPKISIYVLKRTAVPHEEWQYLERTIGTAFWFVNLSLSLLALSDSPKVTVLPEFLASADRDFAIVCFPPEVWKNSYLFFQHHFVKRHDSKRWIREKRRSYGSYINFLYAVSTGATVAVDAGKYERAARTVSLVSSFRTRSVRLFIKAVLMRLGFARAFSGLLRRQTG